MINQEAIKAQIYKKLFLFVCICFSGITLSQVLDYVFPINILNPDFLSIFITAYLVIISYAMLNLLLDTRALSNVIIWLCYFGEMLVLLNLAILGYFVFTEDSKNIEAILVDIKYIFVPMGLLSLALLLWLESESTPIQPKYFYYLVPQSSQKYSMEYSSQMLLP